MASQKKKRKEKNCNSYHGHALKLKDIKLKRLLYFNSSQRKQLNKKQDESSDDIGPFSHWNEDNYDDIGPFSHWNE